ncbi:Molybdenum cofactor sulfurase [Lachnellula suecica]|uniref:Molybdenum cofactor sulfurase n=1 Tax=Lachnellula suecica TaxID=602035 RepID=A0A8T9CIU7_9HELO|nr:Molybdenum cofactor sulfurase [Lachnellula suecica]
MDEGYNSNVSTFRKTEYPMLQDAVYLDHAGTTLYSKSLMERFMVDMMSNLYGNPHSASPSSQLSTNRIEDTRLKVLQFFKADPDEFDVVFVANATAGIKLVMEAFRELEGGFSYGYHKDAHTSIVGVRETAVASRCLDDGDVERWLSGRESFVEGSSATHLFAYPAQSNLDGRRVPLSWIERARCLESSVATYSLLDASAFVSTSQLDLSNAQAAPDFTVLSFYKIFGFPDLGALIVRKDSGAILQQRRYFGGGTVDIVLSVKEQWHALKQQSLHETLEDGTVSFHNIMALDAAMAVHRELFVSMERISKHTSFLAQRLYNGLASLRHANSEPVCVIHSEGFASKRIHDMQGPIVAFNVRNSHGAWVSNTEFERLASVKNIHIRSGGLCNPGGVATSLNLEANTLFFHQPWEIKRNFSAGFRCGVETDIYAGKPTGILRASLGAMSTEDDVETFVSFVREFYTEVEAYNPNVDSFVASQSSVNLLVESLTVYPIKSCGGFNVPPETPWEVKPEGLAWDREWCLISKGTGQALNQKRHPRMALIRPSLDFRQGLLRVSYGGQLPVASSREIVIPLSENPALYSPSTNNKFISSRVCGDTVVAQTYAKKEINDFFTRILGVPCALARFPAGGSGFSTRHSKAHMQKHQRQKRTMPKESPVTGACPSPPTPPDSDSEVQKRPILLSNESPILAISRSSLNALNEMIAKTGGKPAVASVFRANVVLAPASAGDEQPYSEDHWTSIQIGQQIFQMLGSCRRCHMICISQDTAEKDEEPFVTLAKTRRFDSKIFFGSHMCHIPLKTGTRESQCPTIKVGDLVKIDEKDKDS